VQFFGIGASNDITQHIQKLATENLWILRYGRSSVFTILFFMQNRPPAALPDSGKVVAGVGGERVGEALWLTYGSICVLGGGREAPSGGGRWHRRVAAAASLFQRGGGFLGSMGES
jgi:hypothetical protein